MDRIIHVALKSCKALVFINAGSDTVGNASTVGTFHVLRNPKVLETLTNELKEAWPEKEANVGYEKLEKLPYLVSLLPFKYLYSPLTFGDRLQLSKRPSGYHMGSLLLCHESWAHHLLRSVVTIFRKGYVNFSTKPHIPFLLAQSIIQTIVSIAAPFLHDNPDIFTNPEQFDPDRWLQPDSRELETYLVPFSKGPRSCIGVKYVSLDVR